MILPLVGRLVRLWKADEPRRSRCHKQHGYGAIYRRIATSAKPIVRVGISLPSWPATFSITAEPEPPSQPDSAL